MYQPRRVSESAFVESEDAVAFVVAPRRAARTRVDLLRSRVAPTVVSVALLATSGAFALHLNAAAESASAVPAPVRESDTSSRDLARALVEQSPVEGDEAATDEVTTDAATDEAATDEAATDTTTDEAATAATTEGADAFVDGSWAAAFGASAGTKYAQAALTVRSQASDSSTKLGTIKAGEKVSITDKVDGSYRQIAYDGKVGYVLNSKLGDKAPVTKKAPSASTSSTSSGGSTQAADPNLSTSYSGKTVLGLKPKAMVVYNAVTARWSFKAIGGYRASSLSNHQYGGAIDFMTYSDSAKGWEVAKYVAANAEALGIDHIIFEQKIWTPYKPYWRAMADRGSATANHMDHVHVSVKL